MASNTRQRRRPRVLVGITGSVAAVKGPELAIRLSQELNVDVRILLTKGGQNFWQKSRDYNPQHWKDLQKCLEKCANNNEHDNSQEERTTMQLHDAEEEWEGWNLMGDPVLHIDLRDWADVFVIAPLSAHTLAKLAQGFCDDTLSCVARAWDFGHGNRPGKPLLLAPAMNTAMWEHPLTRQHLDTIQGFWNSKTRHGSKETDGSKTMKTSHKGINIIAPQVKTLACGELGIGAMAPVECILEAIQETIEEFCVDSDS